jgi:hypothetical protein
MKYGTNLFAWQGMGLGPKTFLGTLFCPIRPVVNLWIAFIEKWCFFQYLQIFHSELA